MSNKTEHYIIQWSRVLVACFILESVATVVWPAIGNSQSRAGNITPHTWVESNRDDTRSIVAKILLPGIKQSAHSRGRVGVASSGRTPPSAPPTSPHVDPPFVDPPFERTHSWSETPHVNGDSSAVEAPANAAPANAAPANAAPANAAPANVDPANLPQSGTVGVAHEPPELAPPNRLEAADGVLGDGLVGDGLDKGSAQGGAVAKTGKPTDAQDDMFQRPRYQTPIGAPIKSHLTFFENWNTPPYRVRLRNYLLKPQVFRQYSFSSFVTLYRTIMATELAKSSYTFEFLWHDADQEITRQTLTVSLYMGGFLASGKVNLTYRY